MKHMNTFQVVGYIIITLCILRVIYSLYHGDTVTAKEAFLFSLLVMQGLYIDKLRDKVQAIEKKEPIKV